jgi:predicted acetyltransferase
MDGTGTLRNMENPAEWLELNRLAEDERTKPDDWVVSEQFVLMRECDGRILGMIQFRHYFNDFLRRFGGNIGYSVRPSERRKGYATKMLRACMDVCRDFGLDRILITCVVGNEGSRRTILSCGGVLENTVYYEADDEQLERYWITL